MTGQNFRANLDSFKDTEILFGYDSNYQDVIDNYSGRPVHVGATADDEIYMYQVPIDGTNNHRVYVLSKGVIMANVNSSNMFSLSNNKITKITFENFDTSQVANMFGMFKRCSSLTELDVSSFDLSNLENMGALFISCTNLTTIYSNKDWDDPNLYFSNSMFDGCESLTGGNGTRYSSANTDCKYAKIDRSGSPGYFTDVSQKPAGNALSVQPDSGRYSPSVPAPAPAPVSPAKPESTTTEPSASENLSKPETVEQAGSASSSVLPPENEPAPENTPLGEDKPQDANVSSDESKQEDGDKPSDSADQQVSSDSAALPAQKEQGDSEAETDSGTEPEE